MPAIKILFYILRCLISVTNYHSIALTNQFLTVENNYHYPCEYVGITLHHQQRDKSHSKVRSIEPGHL